MGQRYQAFVIAKVIPHGESKAYYRCLVAWHHQWCYEELPILAAHRFLKLVQVKENAEIVRHELQAIQGKFGRSGQEPRITKAPCTYLAFLLAQAWNFDLEKEGAAYMTGVNFLHSLLHADMGSMDGDNNDGISVIDVTDPSNPRYSFAGFQTHHKVARPWSFSDKTVSVAKEKNDDSSSDEDNTASPEPGPEEDDDSQNDYEGPEYGYSPPARNARDALKVYLPVTAAMYAEAWPQEYEMPTEVSSDESTDSQPTAIPSLTELAIAPAVEAAIASGDTSDIEDLVWMPEKTPLIRRALEKYSPFPEAGMPLLIQVLKQEFAISKALDLSGFSLDKTQLLELSSSEDFASIDSLKLPSVPDVTIDTVQAVLTTLPRLRRLVLIDTGVSNDDIATLIEKEPALFYHLEDLIHPYMFKHGPYKGKKYVSAFAYLAFQDRMSGGGTVVTSLPLLHPSHIVQALTDILQTYLPPPKSADPYGDDMMGGFVAGDAREAFLPQVVLGSGVRKEGETWGNRRVTSFPKLNANALHGEGWLFVANIQVEATGYMQMFRMLGLGGGAGGGAGGDAYYGFIQVRKGGKHLVCDLKEFLKALQDEGRPLPKEEAVEGLQDVLNRLKKQKNLRLIKQAEVANLAKV